MLRPKTMGRDVLLAVVLCVSAAVKLCASQSGVCYSLASQLTSQAYYTQTSYTYYYSCGLFGWSRCSATGYSSTLQYRSIITYAAQFACCPGYSQVGGTQTCVDINECAPNGGLGSCQQICINTAGSFYCNCQAGYTLAADGRSCQDANECSSNGGLGPCQQLCTNTQGSFYCSCLQGYLLRNDSLSCDLDECHPREGRGPCEQNCTNTDGSYYCNCTLGYVLVTDNHNCLGPPSELVLVAFNSTALQAGWIAPIGDPNDGSLLSYGAVCRSAEGSGVQYTLDIEEARGTLLTALSPYTHYHCCVWVVTSKAIGPSTCQFATTSQDIPYSPPENVSIVARNSTELDVFWSPPSLPNGPITGYNVYIELLAGSTTMREEVDVQVLTLGHLVPHQTVGVRVSANTSVGEGPLSSLVQGTTLVGAPIYPPRDLSVYDDSITPQGTTVAWKIPFHHDTIVVNYYHLVLWEEQFGTPRVIFNLQGNMTSYSFEALQEYCTYQCMVAAGNDVYGLGPSSSISFTTLEAVPSGPPLDLSGELLSSTSYRLFWNPLTPMDRNGVVRSYFISCSPLEGGKAFSHSVTESNITLIELHPFYTYECRVAAVTIGIGPYTAKYEFKMSPAAPSSPAQNISFVPINSSSVLVAWGPPSLSAQNGVILFYVVLVSEPETRAVLNFTVVSTSVMVGPLLPYYTYTCSIGVFTAGGGTFAEAITIQSSQGAPSGVPRNIIANSTSPYDVMLSWQPPYPVERNGVIVNYTILLGESPDSEHRTFSSQEPRVSLHSLASRTTYFYSIAAGTIVGTGPFSDFQQVTTLEEAVNISLSQGSYSTYELAGHVEVCARLLIEGLDKSVHVILSTEPGTAIGDVNFIPLHNHYFHFSPGMHRDETQCVNMTVLDDGVVKDDEELYAVLSTDDPSVGLKEPYRAVITIINSNYVSVSLKDSIYYTTKATGYTQICALLMEGVLGKIMHMSLAINNTGNESLAEVLGAGYSLQSHQLLFQQGQKINSSTCTNITLSKEGPAIHWEEFSVYLQSSDASVVLSQPSVATVVVTDQDYLILLFARQEYFTSERVGHVQVCVMVSSGHVERPTQVYISTEDMSATEGTEYTPLHSYPLLFSRGHQENDSLCVAIGIQHNNCTTGTLSFGVLLLDTTGVVERAVIRIEDIDVMEIDFEKTNYVFSEAAVVPLCVKIYSGQLATELVLKVQSYDESAHGGVDYILVNQSVTFNRGHTSGDTACVNLTVKHDSVKTLANKTFAIGLSPLSEDIAVHFVHGRVTIIITYETGLSNEEASTVPVTTGVVGALVFAAAIASVIIVMVIMKRRKGSIKLLLVSSETATHPTDTSCAVVSNIGEGDSPPSCEDSAASCAVQHNDTDALIASTAM